MKTLTFMFISIICFILSGPASADSVILPNTFTAGSPAVAAEVNANFDAVKSSVDDNDARITVNESDIDANTARITVNESDIDANTARITVNESDIDANTANIDINTNDINALNTSISSGYVSIHATAFRISHSDAPCNIRESINYSYMYNGTTCGTTNGAILHASIQLPQGVNITGFECGIYDSTAQAGVTEFRLYRQPINTGAYISISGLSSSDDSGYQTLVSTPLSHTVDNSNAGYGIRLILGNGGNDFSVIATSLRIIGCVVAYGQ